MLFFFFFNDTATTEIYTLSLHDALPISRAFGPRHERLAGVHRDHDFLNERHRLGRTHSPRSEEHTSELQSRLHLVCRLLLEKKKQSTRTKPDRSSDPSTQCCQSASYAHR